MQVILFFIVLLLAAPLILFASPLLVWVAPLVLIGLGLSLFADYIRHQEKTIRH